jgi:selenocysteine lyase/cysteine desulfurase
MIDLLAHRLQPHYTRFRVADRLLFTGHSHQAWPDVAFDGMEDYARVSAEAVDHKWNTAYAKVDRLRTYLRSWYDDPDGQYSLAANTHELLVKWISALDLRRKPRIVTTDGEFYSLYRQLRRLEEEGIEVVWVPALPLEGFSERIEAALTDDTAAVMVSHVMFETALIQQELPDLASVCRERRIPLIIDDYHGTNVAPWSLRETDMEDVHILIGGYKYLQWGEGNCFLRYPKGSRMRPAVTGWFASFSTLRQPRSAGVDYDSDDSLFMGATFDSVSQFRAARVADFFTEQSLTPEVLRGQYKAQVSYLRERFLASGIPTGKMRLKHGYGSSETGGFLALEGDSAGQVWQDLADRGVYTDVRGSTLRLGPAPYVTTAQMDAVIEELVRILCR